MFVYRLKRRYDGTAESLALKSRRPHAHPNQHTAEETELSAAMRRRESARRSRRILRKAAPQGLQTLRFGLYCCMRRMKLRESSAP